MRRRSGVRRVVSGHDERGRFDSHDLLRLGARRGIAVVERAAARFHDPQVTRLVLGVESLSECGVAGYDRRPGARLRILPEAFGLPGAIDNSREPFFQREGRMPGESLSAVGFPTVAADRPVEQERPRALRKADAESERDRTAHAAAQDKGRVYL